MHTFAGLKQFASADGQRLGPTEWIEVTQQRVDQFATATDDQQWIHVDPVRAAEGPYGTTIAHGLLTLSLLPRFVRELYTVEGVKMAINYGFDKVRFISPVTVGSRLRALSEIVEVRHLDAGVQAKLVTTVEIDGGEKPAAVIESIVRYIGDV